MSLLPPLQIGKLTLPSPLIIAPMAGVTDYPFRVIARQFGAGLVFCEFVAAEGIIREKKAVLDRIDFREHERPIGVQIFGSKPESMHRSALQIVSQYKPDILDINFGCPVPKIANKGGGAAALKDPGLLLAIVEAVIDGAGTTPVTVKMRAGWNNSSILIPDIGPKLQALGVKAITLHPRTSESRYGTRANWNLIAQLKQAVSIPIIGNGDVKSANDLERMICETNCDGVMIGRAALGNPWIIPALHARLNGLPPTPPPLPAERLAACKRHLELEIEEMGDRVGLDRMRKQFAWYLSGSGVTRALVHELVCAPNLDAAFDRLRRVAESLQTLPAAA